MTRGEAVLEALAQLEADERATVVTAALAQLGALGLARVPVAWFKALGELAKVDPYEAGRLARAMYDHLSAFRPESPAPLDAGFVPTEPARDPRSR